MIKRTDTVPINEPATVHFSIATYPVNPLLSGAMQIRVIASETGIIVHGQYHGTDLEELYRALRFARECHEAFRKKKSPPSQEDLEQRESAWKLGAWNNFRAHGMLWFANRILHAFGWAIVVREDEWQNVTEAVPVRCAYRGFSREDEWQGYKQVAKFLQFNAQALAEEME